MLILFIEYWKALTRDMEIVWNYSCSWGITKIISLLIYFIIINFIDVLCINKHPSQYHFFLIQHKDFAIMR